jgi:hypothetical protein
LSSCSVRDQADEFAGFHDFSESVFPILDNKMQRVMEDTSYAKSIEIYLERCRGVWTLEMKDRNQKDLELFEPFKHHLKKICLGVVSRRTLQSDRPEDVAAEIHKELKYIPAERLIVSSDCGFGRQGCYREIAFYKASANRAGLQYHSARAWSAYGIRAGRRSKFASRCGTWAGRCVNRIERFVTLDCA